MIYVQKFSRYGTLNTFCIRLQEPVVLFRQRNVVCSKNHAKRKTTLCGKVSSAKLGDT